MVKGVTACPSRARNVADYAVYLVVRVVVCVIQTLSLPAAVRLADGLAWLLYHVDRRHRLVADDNLRHAFPGDIDDAERDRLVRAVYRHFCTLLIEIVHLPRQLHPTNWRRYLRSERAAAARRRAAVGPAAAVGDGPFRQLGDGRLRPRPARLHAPTPSPGRWTIRTWMTSCAASASAPARRCWPRTATSTRCRRCWPAAACWRPWATRTPASAACSSISSAGPASTHKAVALLALEYNVPHAGDRHAARSASRCATQSSSRT